MNKKITFKEFAKKHYKDRPRGKEEDIVQVAKKPSLISETRREEIRLDVAEYMRRVRAQADEAERTTGRVFSPEPIQYISESWGLNPSFLSQSPSPARPPSPQEGIRWMNMGLDLIPNPPQPRITSISEEELRRIYSMQEPQSEVEQSDEEDDSVF